MRGTVNHGLEAWQRHGLLQVLQVLPNSRGTKTSRLRVADPSLRVLP